MEESKNIRIEKRENKIIRIEEIEIDNKEINKRIEYLTKYNEKMTNSINNMLSEIEKNKTEIQVLQTISRE
jgi:prefoldin subunit 5